jgi:Leucine-rich repeat (LRR) protein
MTKLRTLALWDNEIVDISPLKELPDLRTLTIKNGNPLSEESTVILDELIEKGVEVH